MTETSSAQLATTFTFVNNMQKPIHRWFRFPAGFSAKWIKEMTLQHKKSENFTLFDPFAGSGTTVLVGEECFANAVGIEAHPFLARIAQAKLCWRADIDGFKKFALDVLDNAERLASDELKYPKLINKCYSQESLRGLDKLKRAWISSNDDSKLSTLTWLALVCILRSTSRAATAPWQYILPKKTKKKPLSPFEAFRNQVDRMAWDMKQFQHLYGESPAGQIYEDDARTCSKVKTKVDLVLTSPPYTNNYDYADATRLEMTFFGEVNRWADLQAKVRSHLIRSCAQHMTEDDILDNLLDDKNLDAIIKDLTEACDKLSKVREQHGGKKRYHLMVAAYFSDLANVWIALRKVCKEGSKVCFVVGDSAPYGVYIPVHKWLGELAVSAGFKSYAFEKNRDRNVRWNLDRKHKVPLQEVSLWVDG
ncbi:MAG: DNA methyltransferase [Candidatus Bathyarchaeia archaeon]|jgi:DNA modification methylase